MALCKCGNHALTAKCCLAKVNSKSWSGVKKNVTVEQALNFAEQLAVKNQWAQASIVVNTVLSKVTNQPKAHYLKGLELMAAGSSAQAKQHLEACYTVFKSSTAYLINYVSVLRQTKHLHKAIQILKQNLPFFVAHKKVPALKYTYDFAEETGEIDLASDAAQGLLSIEPQSTTHWLNAAWKLHQQMRDPDALELIETALTQFPDNEKLQFVKASILEVTGNTDAARIIVEKLINNAAFPQPEWLLLQAKCLRISGNVAAAIAILDSLKKADEYNLSAIVNTQLNYEFLCCLRKMNNVEAVFTAARIMHAADPIVSDFQWQRIANELSANQQRNALSSAKEAQSEVTSDKLFIVGFPRSGTTLLEKLFTTQYLADGQSESNAVPNVAKAIFEHLNKPWWQLTKADWEQLHSQYKTLLTPDYSKSCVESPIVDKNLYNQARLALIRNIDPNAPIIRCLRDPLAIVLSCYFTNFMIAQPWLHSIESIARYLTLLDNHWDAQVAVIGEDGLTTIKYEEIIASNGLTDTLHMFVKHHWRCESANIEQQQKRTNNFRSRTASYSQVVKGIAENNNSEYDHYIPFLTDAEKTLIGDMQEKWHYPRTV